MEATVLARAAMRLLCKSLEDIKSNCNSIKAPNPPSSLSTNLPRHVSLEEFHVHFMLLNIFSPFSLLIVRFYVVI